MKRYIAIILVILTLFLASCNISLPFNSDDTQPTEDAGNSDFEQGNDESEDTRKTYTLMYIETAGGKIEGTLIQKVKEGDSGSVVKAIADDGYEFVEWSDGYKLATRSEYKVKKDVTVSAIFRAQPQDVLDAPIIRIDTENGQAIADKENYVTCEVSVSNTDDDACMEQVAAGIRGRGNSSWMWHDKKSYRIKFDKKQSMLGSDYKAKSWTLIANHADRTLSRNALAYEMAERFEGIAFSSMHQHVEVYLNGEYLGVYLLCDQMQTGTGRVDIEDEMTGDPEAIGYLVEMDGRHHEEGTEGWDYFKLNDLDNGKEYGLKTPDPDDEGYDPDIYLAYIEEYIAECLTALSAEDWDRITSLMDVDSFAEAYIIQELFGNIDVGNYSFYMYKEQGADGKLYCGPVWDFDLSVGNVNYGYGNDYSWAPDADLQIIKSEAIAGGKSEEEINRGTMLAEKSNTWFRRLMRNEEFIELVKQKLIKYDDTIVEVIALSDPDNPDGYYAKYRNSILRNFDRWDILGEYVWPNNQDVYSILTVEDSFVYVNEWLTARYELVKARVGLT